MSSFNQLAHAAAPAASALSESAMPYVYGEADSDEWPPMPPPPPPILHTIAFASDLAASATATAATAAAAAAAAASITASTTAQTPNVHSADDCADLWARRWCRKRATKCWSEWVLAVCPRTCGLCSAGEWE